MNGKVSVKKRWNRQYGRFSVVAEVPRPIPENVLNSFLNEMLDKMLEDFVTQAGREFEN